MQGRFNYYAVPGNLDRLGMFRERVLSMWWHVLCRRSQKRGVTWERMIAIAKRRLPSPRVLHPDPAQRFYAAKDLDAGHLLSHQVSPRRGRLMVALQHQPAHTAALRQPCKVNRINRPRRAVGRRVDVNVDRAGERVLLRESRTSMTKHQTEKNRL
jgi:hypothetical protein